MKQQKAYGNESISSLKGADRVRLRPAVIFGSDGLEGCEHAVFEILSNAIDEAREGYGKQILVTRFADHSIEVEDFGRGCPVDWNEKEGRYNWELVFCELYAGGKYQNNTGGDYEFSLGLNGLGSCATQYSSEYFDATIRRDGYKYSLHFEKGELVGKMKKEPTDRKKPPAPSSAGSPISRSSPTSISPRSTLRTSLKRQAVVNAGVTFRFRNEEDGKFDEDRLLLSTTAYWIMSTELAGEQTLTMPQFWQAERKGRDREDKPEYKVTHLRRLLLLQPRQPSGVLPQLLLARARRRAGKGRQATPSSTPSTPTASRQGKYTEGRVEAHVPGRGRLPRPRDELLLHADLLREPDQKGHHEQIRAGRHDGVLPRAACTSTSSKTSRRPTASPIRSSSTSGAASRPKRPA